MNNPNGVSAALAVVQRVCDAWGIPAMAAREVIAAVEQADLRSDAIADLRVRLNAAARTGTAHGVSGDEVGAVLDALDVCRFALRVCRQALDDRARVAEVPV